MRLLGIIIALFLFVVLFSWLRSESTDLFSPRLRNIFQYSSSSYSNSWSVTSTNNSGPHYITTWKSDGGSGAGAGGGSGGQTGGASPHRGAITIDSVVIGAYGGALTLKNHGSATVGISGWRIQSASALVTIFGGARKGDAFGAAQPIVLAPGESAAIFEGTRDDRATVLAPHATWYAWTGMQFLGTRGLVTVRDEAGREVTRYVY